MWNFGVGYAIYNMLFTNREVVAGRGRRPGKGNRPGKPRPVGGLEAVAEVLAEFGGQFGLPGGDGLEPAEEEAQEFGFFGEG